MKFKLHPLAAALTVGIIWALSIAVITLISMQNGYGEGVLNLIAEVYPMYEISSTGILWGILWGFLDGFIGTYIVVAVYNFFVKKLGKK